MVPASLVLSALIKSLSSPSPTSQTRPPGGLLTSVGLPELLHAVPHEHDARQLRERLDDVEVAQGADLEEGHAVLLGIRPRLLRGHLPLERQVETVAHQDAGNARGMLEKRRKNRGFFLTFVLAPPSG